MKTIRFGDSGSPLLTPEQIVCFVRGKEIIETDEPTDSVQISIKVPPAPLKMCLDEEL